jgi:thiol-disulfide isomerase/thioredoxin
MKTAFSCLLVILWPFLNTICQTTAIPALTVGDAVPELTIRNIVQYTTPTARLSDFKDKVLIIDLMSSICGSCVVHLSHMDSLQMKYKDQLQILPVTFESNAKIKAFLKSPYGKHIRFPFATGDTLLKRMFPHQFISHLVWIYKGRVQAITTGDYVKAANIETLLSGKPLRLPVKKDVGHYDPSIPLLVANPEIILPENSSGFRYYSALIPYMDGFSFGQYEKNDSTAGTYRHTFINWPIPNIYLYAVGKNSNFPAALIRYEVRDSSRFFFDRKGYISQWRTVAYCGYQSSTPLQMPEPNRKAKMLADLDSYLGLHGRLEKRFIRCIVLRPDTSVHALPPKPSGNIIEIFGIASQQNSIKGATPIFIEMPGDDQRYVPRPPDFEDVAAMRTLLQPYGIRITEERREIEMLVISDAPAVLLP